MERKGFTPAAVRCTVKKLKDRGLLDDEKLAAGLADQFQRRGFGPRGVRVKLQQRGFRGREIEISIGGNVDHKDADIARRLIEHRFSGMDLNDSKTRARAYRLLLRRGYSAAVASGAVNEREFL